MTCRASFGKDRTKGLASGKGELRFPRERPRASHSIETDALEASATEPDWQCDRPMLATQVGITLGLE